MLNFGGSFSSSYLSLFRSRGHPSIEQILEAKDCSVDKLLDDSNCLVAFKTGDSKLLKYFDQDKLKTLIDYITVMPREEDGPDRCRKYPFISAEILAFGIPPILDRFFEGPKVPGKGKAGEVDTDSGEDRDDLDFDDDDVEDLPIEGKELEEKKKTDTLEAETIDEVTIKDEDKE